MSFTIPEPYIRGQYRGLNDAEDDYLRAYLRAGEEEIRGLRTQVRVGPGELLPESQPEMFRRSWQESSKYKIDAVVERPSVVELVELKDLIRNSGLGQLLSYRYWYEIEYDLDKPLRLTLTAPDINPTAVQPVRFHDINLFLQTAEGRRHLQQGAEAQPPFDGTGSGL
jgi:hypothetical protein